MIEMFSNCARRVPWCQPKLVLRLLAEKGRMPDVDVAKKLRGVATDGVYEDVRKLLAALVAARRACRPSQLQSLFAQDVAESQGGRAAAAAAEVDRVR